MYNYIKYAFILLLLIELTYTMAVDRWPTQNNYAAYMIVYIPISNNVM